MSPTAAPKASIPCEPEGLLALLVAEGTTLHGNHGRLRLPPKAARAKGPPKARTRRSINSREAHRDCQPSKQSKEQKHLSWAFAAPLAGLEPATCWLEGVSAPSGVAGLVRFSQAFGEASRDGASQPITPAERGGAAPAMHAMWHWNHCT